MEIVPIIYNLLLIGGAVLTVIIIVSYALSKISKKEEKRIAPERKTAPQPMYFDHNAFQKPVQHQVIVPVNSSIPHEIKVVRKVSYDEMETMEHFNGGGNRHTSAGSRRYTILNEEMKNTDYRYANRN